MTGARFDRTPAEQGLLAQGQAIAEAHPRPAGRPLDGAELRAIFRALAPTGYLASTLPREAGGQGLSAAEFCALCEGLAPGLTLIGNHSVQRYLQQFGDAAQRARFLPALLEGDGVGAIAMTEPQVGSDLERMTTTARRSGHGYVIDGEKTWVTHGLSATLIVLLAKTDHGLTRFLVPGDAPGVRRIAMEPVGLRHLGFARLAFDGCEVPAEWRLGGEGEGLRGAKAAFPIARVIAATQAVRIARAAVAIARDYAEGRSVARAPLAGSSLVQHGIAHLSARCEAVSLLCRRVADDLQAEDVVATASAAKALAGELALDACRWTEDLLGSTSLEAAHPLATLAGDARMMAVVDGTSVLNHLVVARRLLPVRGGAA
ncbi:MAG: acyl-CoA/acyl-ACP dehydrogenase [Proteobacteria bacterium]|nr:acyl-CoA/acyl-ACP dehydrogenase [Pseudomonadota bacterium]